MTAAKKATNPFFDVDFTKFTTDFKLPGVDVNEMMAFQRKNIEALTKANKVAFDGFQAVAQRQSEIFKSLLEQVTSQSKGFSTTSTENPMEAAAKQAEVAKDAYESALANAKELTGLVSKSQEEATALLQARFSESLDELKAAISKAAASK
ncbi:phasin family protein [Thalassospira sp.]|uniref:phasin family protein n=1 Tax=Thalassospira sp. TaxID=1912094 RepID=UPI002733CD02|nr:TIGR01841 family phasin [Thalassospira sp.]MDP2697209.1 TIGR01841 family phasin [Thalassospira sp.]